VPYTLNPKPYTLPVTNPRARFASTRLTESLTANSASSTSTKRMVRRGGTQRLPCQRMQAASLSTRPTSRPTTLRASRARTVALPKLPSPRFFFFRSFASCALRSAQAEPDGVCERVQVLHAGNGDIVTLVSDDNCLEDQGAVYKDKFWSGGNPHAPSQWQVYL